MFNRPLAAAGALFVIYPLVRPWGDATPEGMAAAFGSPFSSTRKRRPSRSLVDDATHLGRVFAGDGADDDGRAPRVEARQQRADDADAVLVGRRRHDDRPE